MLRCYNGSKQQLNDMKQHLKEIGQCSLFFGLVLIAFITMVNLFNM